jgi:hypothetical protein
MALRRMRPWLLRPAALVGAALVGLALVGGAALRPSAGTQARADDGLGNAVGLTKVATSAHYIVVLNIVAPEEMFTPEQTEARHPTEGELIIRGHMAPIRPDSRHTEAHVYAKDSGRAVTDVTPVITVVDETSGQTQTPEPTLMQDIAIGPRDVHFGNNVDIPLGHEITVRVDLGAESVSFSGHLL